jgi:hypothetical protein
MMMMMIRDRRTFTAVQTIAWKSMLGQKTTATTATVQGGQSLRLFASKHPTDSSSSSFELRGHVNMTIKPVPLVSQDKLLARRVANSLELTRTVVHIMTNDQIKAELEKLGMPTHGTKTERADRLLTVIPSKISQKRSTAQTIHKTINNTVNTHNHFNNTTNHIINQKNETVYQESTPINNDMDETTSSEESKKQPEPVEISPVNNDMDETTSSEESNKE